MVRSCCWSTNQDMVLKYEFGQDWLIELTNKHPSITLTLSSTGVFYNFTLYCLNYINDNREQQKIYKDNGPNMQQQNPDSYGCMACVLNRWATGTPLLMVSLVERNNVCLSRLCAVGPRINNKEWWWHLYRIQAHKTCLLGWTVF